MSATPPKMSAPMEGPSSPRGKTNPTAILLTVLGGVAAAFCIGGGILLAFLAPRIRDIRTAARSNICANNLRVISQNIALYSADNDDHLPIAEEWMDEIHTKGINTRSFRCPEARIANRDAFGYAFSSALGSKKQSELDLSTPVVFDSTLLGRNASSGLETLPTPGRHLSNKLHTDNLIMLNGTLESRVK